MGNGHDCWLAALKSAVDLYVEEVQLMGFVVSDSLSLTLDSAAMISDLVSGGLSSNKTVL